MIYSKHLLKYIFLLFAVICVFIGSGLYHINQFETSDEHFWRLERVPQYWQALSQKDFAKTYINDKPGISIALISGTGLPFISQNQNDYISKQDYTMTLNHALRLPILLFNGLVMLPLIFWLLLRAFDKQFASISIILIGLNPILIGISQIINPDALLWSFSAAALLSFFALLKTQERKFIIFTGILTGFALLSKYTANLLFIFYIIIAGLHIIYSKIDNIKTFSKTLLQNYLYIYLIALTIFILFLPAVFSDISLLLYGTIFSPPMKPIILPVGIFVLLFTIDVFFINARITTYVVLLIKKIKTPILYFSVIPLFFLIIFSLINAWTNAHFITLDNLKEIIANTQILQFPMLEGLPAPIYFIGEIAIQSFGTLFSLTSSILILTILTIILVFLKKTPLKYHVVIIFCAIVPFLFFVGGLISETFVNTRYAIILQITFALLASVGTTIITSQKKNFFIIVIICLFIAQSISIILSAPHYFNYQNIFLPKQFTLTDSWGYGIFEAVQYLNSLPNAKNLTIWSDTKVACYYFNGNCIVRREIDALNNIPDYFIITKTGINLHRFKWLNYFDAPYSIDTVYSKKVLNNPLWQFNILNRQSNYIKIIDAHNLSDLSFVNDVNNIKSPTFPDTTCNILNFGAQSTLTRKQINDKMDVGLIIKEKELNTQAFAKAIAECSQKGGGIVEVPAGLWLTKSIHLKSNINLHLTQDATILFSDEPNDFLPVVKTRFVGLDLYNYSPMIYVFNSQNVAITGTGTIDGNGETPIWNKFFKNQRKSIKKLYKMSLDNVPIEKRIFGPLENSLRPSLIQFYNSQNIFIDKINIIGGPMWTIHPIYSKNIIITNTNIDTRATNGDGIAIDSSENVLIKSNTLSTSDDAIVIKSGRDEDGLRVNKPSQNIVIRDNTITRAHAGVGFGSEMSGGIQNILVDNTIITNAYRGFRFKTTLGRGGYIRNITIQNSYINNPKTKGAINISMNYDSSTIKPKTKKPPTINNIKFKNIAITTSPQTIQDEIIIIDGIKDHLSHLLFDNMSTNNDKSTAIIKNTQQILFNNVAITNYFIKSSKDVTIINDECSVITQEDNKNISNICNK